MSELGASISDRARGYLRELAPADAIAALVVTLLVIPQGLAYAVLAGLPPEMGLYASILPMAVYALLGSSRSLSVGPVAVTAIMTGSALSGLAPIGSEAYIQAALALTLLSGLALALMGLLRLGSLSHLLSHPVISGFVSAAALLIALSQLGPLVGVPSGGDNLPERLHSLWQNRVDWHGPTTALGLGLVLLLLFARRWGPPSLIRLGATPGSARLLTQLAAPLLLILSMALVALTPLGQAGVETLGQLPEGLPPLSLPRVDPDTWLALAPAALLIGLVGFVESVSMARTLAAKGRERVVPDRELLGLGAANLAAGCSGGMPVTGGFSRSAVNQQAGARTRLAGLWAALLTALSLMFFLPLLSYLPMAGLAAMILVAVMSLVSLNQLPKLWRYAPGDALAMLVTFVAVLVINIEVGLLLGIGVSLVVFIWQTRRPHIAVVGQVPGTEHFRNLDRHEVITRPGLLQIRIDESLYFANAHYLEDRLEALANAYPDTRDLVLQCTAINHIDGSALESLEAVQMRLQEAGIRLHLSEVKGPVMDRLKDTEFLHNLNGQVFLSHQQAVAALSQRH